MLCVKVPAMAPSMRQPAHEFLILNSARKIKCSVLSADLKSHNFSQVLP
jgi:hypothetical protein